MKITARYLTTPAGPIADLDLSNCQDIVFEGEGASRMRIKVRGGAMIVECDAPLVVLPGAANMIEVKPREIGVKV